MSRFFLFLVLISFWYISYIHNDHFQHRDFVPVPEFSQLLFSPLPYSLFNPFPLIYKGFASIFPSFLIFFLSVPSFSSSPFSVPLLSWAFSTYFVISIMHSSPNCLLVSHTRETKWYLHICDLSHLRVWGQAAAVYLQMSQIYLSL